MRRSLNFMIGVTAGVVAGLAVHYLFGPSDQQLAEGDTLGEVPYKSRLDAAIEAGRQAAAEREAELTAAFEEAKRIAKK